jgi:hypothetical protein
VEAGFVILIVIGIVAVILIRLAAGGLDRDRVREYVASRGGKVLEANWDPFGPGWFGEKSDRIYEVRYVDRDGNEHHAHCKTSMWTGVYFTEDTIVKYAHGHPPAASALEEENRRLREELERLKRGEAP